jgi:flagellar L-ring protein precursor FlgH
MEMTKNNIKSIGSKLLLLILVVVAAASLSACSTTTMKEIEVPSTPRYITPPRMGTTSPQSMDGSLYVKGSRVAQTRDFRAYDINDLVSIKVVESTTATNSANVSTERDDTSARALTNLLSLEKLINLIPTIDTTAAVNGNNSSDYSSAGSNNRTETISSTLTARIIDRMPNGNLVLMAQRNIIVNQERQVMVVQGIVRPVDIEDDNSIISTKIADLQIQYGGSGVISESMRRGWASRAINYIWPF